MNMLRYKGYTGIAEFDSEAGHFHGEVQGIRDIITFISTDSDQLRVEFVKSVDDYLKWCKESGTTPDQEADALDAKGGTLE